MNDDFPAASLIDPLGTRILLTEDDRQDGCLALRLQPRAGGEPEAVLNRTTVILLRKALGLWLEHLDGALVPIMDDEAEP